MLECRILLPEMTDLGYAGNRWPHPAELWTEFDVALLYGFGGFTILNDVRGKWFDERTKRVVVDNSRHYLVATEDVDSLRQLLAQYRHRFEQCCIYLSVAGVVEFIAE